MMRIWRVAVLALAALTTVGCAGSGVFRQYEYEEDITLSLDGKATIYVNASLAALDALRGAPFDIRPNARLDRDAVRRFSTTPVTRVTRGSQARRRGRRFVYVRVEVDDVRRLGAAPPFQ